MGLFDKIWPGKQRSDLAEVEEIENRLDALVARAINRTIARDQEMGPTRSLSVASQITRKILKFFGRVFTSNRISFAHNSGYDMQRMLRAIETESFISRVIDSYIVSVLQKGYDFIGNNPRVVEYIKRRFFEMEIVTDTPMRSHISKMTNQLIGFGNVFLTKIRSVTASSGKPWTRFDGKEFQPLAGIEIQDTVPMRIEYNYDRNKPVSYYQFKQSTYGDDGRLIRAGSNTTGRSEIWGDGLTKWYPDDVVHVKFHPMPGRVWAMPPFMPVLEDILALREIEESIQLLVYQYGHMLLHATVDVQDAEKKQAEISNIIQQLEQMEGNGAIVTGAEVKMNAIGSEGRSVRAESYLNYFQQRVLAGLFTSQIAMGQGSTSNRNTAEFVDKQKQDLTCELQQIIIEAFQPVIDELLFEAGMTVEEVWRNRVALWFPNPDINTKIKIEQHAMLLYQSNCITEPEMREMIGQKALTEEERNLLYYRAVGMDQLQNELQANLVLTQASARLSSANNTNSKGNSTVNKGQGASKAAAQKLRPANQHGRNAGPGSIKNVLMIPESTFSNLLDPEFVKLLPYSYYRIEEDNDSEDDDDS